MKQVDGGAASRHWADSLFRPLALATMVGCVIWSLTQLMLRFAPNWNPTYVVVGCVLVALEAFYSYRLLRARRNLRTNVLNYRIAELLVILVLFKLGRYTTLNTSQTLTEIHSWPRDLSRLFDLETLAAFALALSCWAVVTETAKDFDDIGRRPERGQAPVSPIDRITNRFLVGGIVLLVAAGFAHLEDISDLLDIDRPSVQGLVFNALIYFAVGLAMLGQMQFTRLHKAWQRQQVWVSDDLGSHWVRYSLFFVGLAALLAFILPTGFASSPLQVAADALAVMGQLVYFVFAVLVALISLPFSLLWWLLSLLFSEGQDRPHPELGLPALDPPPDPGRGDIASWLELARSLAFWVVLLVGLFFVIHGYLRDRPELREAFISMRPVRALRRGWATLSRWLGQWFSHLRQAVNERAPRWVPRKFSRDSLALPKPFRFFRLGALSPRERVLYYYLSIVRRAGKQGFPRRAHQTPHEYSSALKPHLPQAQEDMETLTHAFLEARYSQRAIEPDQDLNVRTNWERVKAALRALKPQAGQEE